MRRVLAILILALAGLPGLGFGTDGGQGDAHVCDDSGCRTVVVEVSCCGETTFVDYCSNSGGPCSCDASPRPDRSPRPGVPLPNVERNSLVAVMQGGVRVESAFDLKQDHESASAFLGDVQSGLSHRELRALLGNWRT